MPEKDKWKERRDNHFGTLSEKKRVLAAWHQRWRNKSSKAKTRGNGTISRDPLTPRSYLSTRIYVRQKAQYLYNSKQDI